MSKVRNVTIGDKLLVKAAPASHYSFINGDAVKVVVVFNDETAKGNPICYGFIHSQVGYGVLQEHGFTLPKNAEYKKHSDEVEISRDEAISFVISRKNSLDKISKFTDAYNKVKAEIKVYEEILVKKFGFNEELLASLYEGSK